MRTNRLHPLPAQFLTAALAVLLCGQAQAQLTDITQAPNTIQAGIQKSFQQQIGAGRGDALTPDSSSFLIQRDPFRSIVRGRQLFQRKYTVAQGLGPRKNDGIGNLDLDGAIGAGLSDSCAGCHGRPFGAAGFGGNVFTRPDSRDAPHLFGLGLKEMLADEITHELRAIRTQALLQAAQQGADVTLPLLSKTIAYGAITAHADGTLDTSAVQGVNPDLRVRPFFAEGKAISMREFIVGALKAEMGLEAFDPDLLRASQGQDVLTPSGMLLSGSLDAIDAPPATSGTMDGDADGVADEIPVSIVDHFEFYLLNYFKPGLGEQTVRTQHGMAVFQSIGCASCHVRNLTVDHDRRVADVSTVFDPLQANNAFSRLFATASTRFDTVDDGTGLPPLCVPQASVFRVRNIFTDFKRHDLGQGFHERNFDGAVTTQFLTTPLWGVGSTPPYGHDGRSLTLEDAILRHGGEAQAQRDSFAGLPNVDRADLLAALESLLLFSPPDTASNLAPANPAHPQFPMLGHGSIDLSVLFLVPANKE